MTTSDDGPRQQPPTDSVSSKLFAKSPEAYGEEQYQSHLLEQYKLYIGTAETNSSRRLTANSFFLTINTAVLAFLGLVTDADDRPPLIWVLTISVAGSALCYYWYRLVRSYRGLNSGKFKVVHQIEKQLPLALFDAEWDAVGRGKAPALYLPVSHIEQRVPWVFLLLYVALAGWHVAASLGWT